MNIFSSDLISSYDLIDINRTAVYEVVSRITDSGGEALPLIADVSQEVARTMYTMS
jgi:hypothetical protein